MDSRKTTLLACLGVISIAVIMSFTFNQEKNKEGPHDYVTIAILAKDKAHTLPLYLSCIEQQTWPAHKSYLYIRTNNNNDDTLNVLRQWVERVGHNYAGVHFDASDLETPVQNYGQHEWNAVRFKILGKIRQDSIDFAHKNQSHYFVVDCDNFIQPKTIENLMQTNLPITAPLLRVAEPSFYGNCHAAIDQNGYYADSPHYYDILLRKVKGLIEVPVVHCSYLIRHDILDKISYDDNSFRYEYVIFSDSARKHNIPQYLDNRELYGRITFTENKGDFEKEPWIYEFQSPKEQIPFGSTSIRNGNLRKDKDGIGISGEGSTAENTKSL
ncbi:MAG: glycosyltransferase family 2 protein [Parachlamydiaceae bacterium]|nr:glycosyltransferase family 2 protein [Parachlamydiaceae bacterium]